MVAYQDGNGAEPPCWLATPAHDFTKLAHALLPQAERLLATQGVFAPQGAAMDLRGGIIPVTPPATSADPAALMAQVHAALRADVRARPRRAAAVIANCTVILPGAAGPTQAAVVSCAYRDGTGAQVAYPYTLVHGRITFGPPAWEEGGQDIFPPIRLRPHVRADGPPRPAGHAVGLFMVRGVAPDALLRHLGLTTDGAGTDTPAARLCMAALPDGWCVLWCNDMADAPGLRLKLATQGVEVIFITIDEHACRTRATGYHGGVEVWSVAHDGSASAHDLVTTGQPPACLPGLVADMEREEVESGYPPGAVDFYFDIPVALVHALTGFSYWQRAVFTPLA